MKINRNDVPEGKFVLKDIVYDITSAVLFAASEDMNLFLFPEIDAETGDSAVEYEMRSIYLYHNNGFNTHVSSFEELKGKQFVWNEEYNTDDEEAGTLYVQEHMNIAQGMIEILDVKDRRMTIRWNGLADICWSEEYGDNVPFATVFSVEIPDMIVYRIDGMKSDRVNIDQDTQLALLNLAEFNAELAKTVATRQWDCFSAVLEFKLTYAGTEFFGDVIFINGKNNFITNFDEACPRRVMFRGVEFNFKMGYEMFSFEIQ